MLSLVWDVGVVGLKENCCGWSTETFRESRGMGTSAVLNRHQKTDDDEKEI